MTTPSDETCPAELPNWCAQRHWAIFWIIIFCSVSVVGGRILTVRNYAADGQPAFFSANDRSRWATVRGLGDEGTYQIESITRRKSREEISRLTKQAKQAGSRNHYFKIRWDTIDQVRHVGQDGKFHFYSSKPTLLPTILAGGYIAIHQLTGWTMNENSVPIIRALLLMLNGVGWFVFLYFFAKTINSVPVRDWSRYYVLGCAGFGTFLSTFAVVLNNHLPAAVSVMTALYMLTLIWRKPDCSALIYATAGFFAAFAFANELPAASFFASAAGIAAMKSFKKTLLAFAPAALLILAAALFTNYQAHGTWELAYMHRHDGETVATVNGDFWKQLDDNQLPPAIKNAAEPHFDMTAAQVEPDGWPSTPVDLKRWVVRDQLGIQQYVITNSSASHEYQIRVWNNWYDYPQSYWSKQNHGKKSRVDRGQVNRVVYAFHLLFGHHGIFSLTPIWIFSFAGMVAMLLGYRFGGRFQMRWLGGLTLLLSVVVIAFYLRRPTVDCNYGGVTSGLRWGFWLIPFWLVTMLPVVDWLAKFKTGKLLCYALLTISVLSAGYSAYNPWVHPWLYEIWDITGIVK